MVRSTAISWTIGVAVTALALQSWQLPALAEDGSAKEVETRSQPLEPTVVRVILLPPASDTVFTSWRPLLPEGARIVMVRTAGNAATAEQRLEPVEAGPVAVQPAEAAAIVPPRPEPEKLQGDVTLVERPSLPERRPRVALLPPASDAVIDAPRPEAAKTQDDATSVAIPLLPERSPFRQTRFKSEIVKNGPDAAATRQQAPEPAAAKGSAPPRYFADLSRGDKGASTPVSSTAAGSASPAGDGKVCSPGPSTASTSAPVDQGQAEAGPKSGKSPIKRFLDGIQFWKN